MASEVLAVRIDEKVLQEFKTICKMKFHREHQDVVKELITAFADGRVSITPTEAQENLINEVYTKGENKQ